MATSISSNTDVPKRVSRAPLLWERQHPQSVNNFDLVLRNPQEVDTSRIHSLIDAIARQTHRGLSLSSRATRELRRWSSNPSSALLSSAYVLLSNWFMTNSGDRSSSVATCCEALWDELFACRPTSRLSSPEAGRNHLVDPVEFERFWRALQHAIGGTVAPQPDSKQPIQAQAADLHCRADTVQKAASVAGSALRAVFRRGDIEIELEGPPEAIAEFFRRI